MRHIHKIKWQKTSKQANKPELDPHSKYQEKVKLYCKTHTHTTLTKIKKINKNTKFQPGCGETGMIYCW